MKRKVEFVEGEYYHLYNRGNSKQLIFLDDQDRDRFVKLLYLCNSNKSLSFREDIVKQKIDAWDFDRGNQIVSVGAWVLMPNHFHILLTICPKPGLGHLGQMAESETGNYITIFMHKVLTSYSKYFNKKYQRTGGLFEDRFKSVHVDSDEFMKYLFSYIHLNPVKLIDSNWKESGIKDFDAVSNFLHNYKWSSYFEFVGQKKRVEEKVLSTQDFPEYFTSCTHASEELYDWMTYDLNSDSSPKPGLGLK